jgi:hypothetical protein
MSTPSFRLCYLPVNMAWVFLFGDTPIRLDYVDQTLFPTRADAISAALLCGLWVSRDGHVSVARRAAA